MLNYGLKEKYEILFKFRNEFNEAKLFFLNDLAFRKHFDFNVNIDEIYMKIHFNSKVFKNYYSFIFENINNNEIFNEVNFTCLYEENEYLIFTSLIIDDNIKILKDMISELIYFLKEIDPITKNTNLLFKYEIKRKFSYFYCINLLMSDLIIDEFLLCDIRNKINDFFNIEDDHNSLFNFEKNNLKHRIFLIPYLAISSSTRFNYDKDTILNRSQYLFFIEYLKSTKCN